MTNITKEARKDAQEFVSAGMSFGDGAGIRRRHIDEAVQWKMDMIPGYATAFENAKRHVDVTKAVKSAKRTSTNRDLTDYVSKNARALARGDRQNISPLVLVAVVGLAAAHQTGKDKEAVAYVKRKTSDVRSWLKRQL